MQLTLEIDTDSPSPNNTTYESLADRIQSERIEKQNAQPFTCKSIAKNPAKFNFSLTIQRNLRWSDQQKSSLIESILLGYPIPPVYTLKSADNVLWCLDGKQRLTTIAAFIRGEFSLTDLSEVYGINISGMKFSDLPEEFQEVIELQNVVVYQLERLTTEQRDQLFKRLNSGTPLTPIELTRSVLGSDMLDYVNELLQKPFFQLMEFSEKQIEKFADQELALQVIGIITEQLKDMSRPSILSYALELRTNGITDHNKVIIDTVLEYLYDGFGEFDKVQKVLKKNDVIALVGAALEMLDNITALEFAGVTYDFIVKNNHAYSETKRSASGSAGSIKKRIDLLVAALKESETE